jgi:hypothetical protein
VIEDLTPDALQISLALVGLALMVALYVSIRTRLETRKALRENLEVLRRNSEARAAVMLSINKIQAEFRQSRDSRTENG